MSKLADERNELTAMLKSLIADIEAMHEKGDRFGPFDVDTYVAGRAYIEWPNLAILLDEAKQKLKGKHE